MQTSDAHVVAASTVGGDGDADGGGDGDADGGGDGDAPGRRVALGRARSWIARKPLLARVAARVVVLLWLVPRLPVFESTSEYSHAE